MQKKALILSQVCMRFPINSFLGFPFYDTYSEVNCYRIEQGNHIEGYYQLIIGYSLTAHEISEFIDVLDGIIVFALEMLQDGGQMPRESWSSINATADRTQLKIDASWKGEMFFPLLQLYLTDLW